MKRRKNCVHLYVCIYYTCPCILYMHIFRYIWRICSRHTVPSIRVFVFCSSSVLQHIFINIHHTHTYTTVQAIRAVYNPILSPRGTYDPTTCSAARQAKCMVWYGLRVSSFFFFSFFVCMAGSFAYQFGSNSTGRS